MENIRVNKIEQILKLHRKIVGIRFLVYKKDYLDCPAQSFTGKLRLCGFVNKANYGSHLKVTSNNFSCTGGPTQSGMKEASDIYSSGQGYKYSGLYSDLAIGKEVFNSFSTIPQHIYCMEIGPLEALSDADVVIILGMADQIMQIMQGYTYHYGPPNNFTTVGNAAMCSDMMAKPFMRNDINLSLMCCGARTSTISDCGELGVGMPSHMFRYVADGILKINNIL